MAVHFPYIYLKKVIFHCMIHVWRDDQTQVGDLVREGQFLIYLKIFLTFSVGHNRAHVFPWINRS